MHNDASVARHVDVCCGSDEVGADGALGFTLGLGVADQDQCAGRLGEARDTDMAPNGIDVLTEVGEIAGRLAYGLVPHRAHSSALGIGELRVDPLELYDPPVVTQRRPGHGKEVRD